MKEACYSTINQILQSLEKDTFLGIYYQERKTIAESLL